MSCYLHFDDVIEIESSISQNVKMINLQTLKKTYNIVVCTIKLKKKNEIADVSKI